MKLKSKHFFIAILLVGLVTYTIGYRGLDRMPEANDDKSLKRLSHINLEEKISSTEAVGILFYDKNSVLCKKVEYQLYNLQDNSQIDLYKVDINDCPDFLGVSGTPSLIFLRNGSEINRIMGVVSDSNLKMIVERIKI